MGSTAICGKPRGGKSFYGTKILLNEVLPEKDPDTGEYKNRTIITNIPLKLPECEAYMERHYPDWYSQIGDFPVHVIPVAEEAKFVKEFWRYREGLHPTHPSISKEEYKEGRRPDWTLNDKPVVYFLDEVHKFLNSRNWQATGLVILDYMSQHAHFGDDVYWLTQAVKNVDSQFRSVTQEYRLIRNLAKERMGKFRKGNGFRLSVYQQESMNERQADYREKFPFDKEIGECYHTSIIGGKADNGSKVKAYPMWVMWLLFAIVAAVIIIGVAYGPEAAVKAFRGKKDTEAEALQEESPDLLGDALRKQRLADLPSQGSELARLGDRKAEPKKTVSSASKVSTDTTTTLVPLHNLRPSEVGAYTLNGVTFTAVEGANAVLVTGSKRLVAEAAIMLTVLDSRSTLEPVNISAVIATVDIDETEASGLGVLANLFAEGVASRVALQGLDVSLERGQVRISGGAQSLDFAADLAARSGRFSVVARPFMSTVNGVAVQFSSGREIPIETLTRDQVSTTTTTTFRAVELALTVTPILLETGDYLVTILQENADVIDADQGTVPPIATQRIQTTVRVSPGEVVALGGIALDTAGDAAEGLPGVVRVPLLRRTGTVARTSQRTEIVLMLAIGGGNAKIPANQSVPALQPGKPTFTPEPASQRPDGLRSRPEVETSRKMGVLDRIRARRNRRTAEPSADAH